MIDDTAYGEVQEWNIPDGEFAVHSGMHVEAMDGHVGTVDALVRDPTGGEVTTLLLREGHLWGKREVATAVSAVDYDPPGKGNDFQQLRRRIGTIYSHGCQVGRAVAGAGQGQRGGVPRD